MATTLLRKRAVVPTKSTPTVPKTTERQVSPVGDRPLVHGWMYTIWNILQGSHLKWWVTGLVFFNIVIVFNLDYEDAPYDKIDSRNGLTHIQLTQYLETNENLSRYGNFEHSCLDNNEHFNHGFIHLLLLYITEFIMYSIFGALFYSIECIWDKCTFKKKLNCHCIKRGLIVKMLMLIVRVVFNHVLRYWMIFIKLYLDSLFGDINKLQIVIYTAKHGIGMNWHLVNDWDDMLNIWSAIKNQLEVFVSIFVRLHPKSYWMIRLGHGYNYIILIFATFQKRPSHMCLVLCLATISGIYFLGDISHQMHGDKQLACVREGLVTQTKLQSLYIATFRRIVAPYVNVVCLSIDCDQFV